MGIEELRRALRQAEAERDRLLGELENLRSREAVGGDDVEGIRERMGNVNRGIARADERVREISADLGAAALAERRGRPDADRFIDGREADREREARERGDEPRNPERDAALRAIERLGLEGAAGDRLVDLIERDSLGLDARYIAAVSTAAYERAFGLLMQFGDSAYVRMSAAEVEAVRTATRVDAERAMSSGVPAGGGYAVPAALDPSIMLTSDGALNPIRRLATVSTITVTEWKGVTSEGVSASFDPEATEVGDDSPTLGQPTIKPEKLQIFVPFSIEIGMDYANFQREMARLLADARDNLEAEKFLTGDGTDEPEGILVGATEAVVTAGASLAAGDFYAAQEALPPRFQPRASWLTSLAIANDAYRFWNPTGTEPPLFNEARDRLLGKPWAEVSGMAADDTAGEPVAVYGSIAEGYRIVDRIGLTVELVPHLFGASRRPTGQRGLYAYARTGAAVVIPNALRVLTVAT